jgi:acyl-CoA reductase-like NAD-dependent aldehyde dehydrogenase
MSKAIKENVINIKNYSNVESNEERLSVAKTYKLYINGAFPRSESGRYYEIKNKSGKFIANAALASKKDLRDAVVSARNAFNSWSNKTAYNRGQILYRMAEILEDRRSLFEAELTSLGYSIKSAINEINQSIDRLVCFAGWTDKFQQLSSTVNPVNSSHFVFSNPEPMGVVVTVTPEEKSLLSLVSLIAPAVAGGNTVIALSSDKNPLSAITFAEVLNASDVPSGVINILTGNKSELIITASEHMDINAIIISDLTETQENQIRKCATNNLKRVFKRSLEQIEDSTTAQSPYTILDTQEIKTTWHPIGR